MIGCGRKGGSQAETLNIPKPIGLVLEKKITGVVLGRNLSRPHGVTSDDYGRLFVVDAGNNRLLKLDRDFGPVREAGGFGSSEGLLSSPTYIAIDNNLNLYVSDAGNQRISIYDAGLNFVESIDLIDPDDPMKFGRPAGLAVDNHGELMLADPDKSRVAVFDNLMTFDRYMGDIDSYSGLLLTPQAIADESGGNIIVADPGRSRLVRFDVYGIYLAEFGEGNLDKPSGIDVDSFGNIWVIDAGLSAVICFSSDGKKIFSVGSPCGEGDYCFSQPRDLTVLPGNRLGISDTGHDRLLIYRVLYPE
jgi:streptogramin lyase